MNMNHEEGTHGQTLQDELDIIGFLRVLWKHRIVIASVVVVSGLASSIATAPYFTPKIYRAEALLAPVGEGGQRGGASSPFSRLGGLASMAGIKMSDGNVDEKLAILKSREFLWLFIKKHNLSIDLSNEKDGNIWDIYRTFDKMLDVRYDSDTKLLRLAIVWTDPEKAAFWVNLLVGEFNEYVRIRKIERNKKNLEYLNHELARTRVDDFRLSLFGLIAQEQKKTMLANTQTEYAFRVLDKAVAPDMKFGPKRAKAAIITMFIGLLAVIFWVFLREFISKAKIKKLYK